MTAFAIFYASILIGLGWVMITAAHPIMGVVTLGVGLFIVMNIVATGEQ